MKYKNEINRFMDEGKDITPTMDMEHFIELMLASLANQSKVIYINDQDKNKRTACLPLNYKSNIEDIMYYEDWGIEFSKFIDIRSYYDNQLEWEKKFCVSLTKYLEKANKKYELNFENDVIRIDFTKEEIDNIFSNYDQDVIKCIDHFTSLLGDYTYTRIYKFACRDSERSRNIEKTEKEKLMMNTLRKHPETVLFPW